MSNEITFEKSNDRMFPWVAKQDGKIYAFGKTEEELRAKVAQNIKDRQLEEEARKFARKNCGKCGNPYDPDIEDFGICGDCIRQAQEERGRMMEEPDSPNWGDLYDWQEDGQNPRGYF